MQKRQKNKKYLPKNKILASCQGCFMILDLHIISCIAISELKSLLKKPQQTPRYASAEHKKLQVKEFDKFSDKYFFKNYL